MKNSFHFSVLMLAVIFSSSTFAVQPKQSDAAQQALKKAQGVLKQLNEEKAAIEAEKNALAQEKAALATDKTVLQSQVEKLENTVKQLSPLQAEVAAQKSTADSLRNTNGALNSQLSRLQANERELNKKLQDTIAQNKLTQADNQILVSAVQERERWIGRCGEKNRDVIAAANELSAKYQSKSAWATLSEIEPFTGIGNVETQNTLQNYQFKLDDLKVTPFEKDVNLPH